MKILLIFFAMIAFLAQEASFAGGTKGIQKPLSPQATMKLQKQVQKHENLLQLNSSITKKTEDAAKTIKNNAH